MTLAGFLDTGIVVGYCFTIDKYHRPCSTYLSQAELLPFASETVENEYKNQKNLI